MKRLVVAIAAGACTLGVLAAPAVGDSKNWTPEKSEQILINRCANAGTGNGGEILGGQHFGCRDREDGGEIGFREVDPGNSGDHNANNNP